MRRSPIRRRIPLRRQRPRAAVSRHDVVEYRQPGTQWRVATVLRALAASVEVCDERTLEVIVIAPPSRLWLRSVHGKRLMQGKSQPETKKGGPQLDPAFLPPPVVVAVRTAATLRPVPKAPPPYRSDEYLDFVAEHACCNPLCPERDALVEAHHAGEHGVGEKAPDTTAVPLSRGCHTAVTDTYALPSHSRAETERLFDRVQVNLLTEWNRRQEERAPAIPLLHLVAAAAVLIILWFCPGRVQAAEPTPEELLAQGLAALVVNKAHPAEPIRAHRDCQRAAALIARGERGRGAALVCQARAAVLLGWLDEATMILRTALVEPVHPLGTKLLLADLLAQQGKCTEARRLYLEVIDEHGVDEKQAREGLRQCGGDDPPIEIRGRRVSQIEPLLTAMGAVELLLEAGGSAGGRP